MIDLDTDIAVLGSGFGGSLTARLLQRLGLRTVLLDRARHPRFAIGESSTPVADLVLSQLCQQYDLTDLAPLAKYGSWKRAYPDVVCGLKRGFSYFRHCAGAPFQPCPEHSNELLVAASDSDELSDTHWLRSDVDTLFMEAARRDGTVYLDETRLDTFEHTPRWTLSGRRAEQPVRITATFVVDATGEGRIVPRALSIADRSDLLRTQSRSIFAHFNQLVDWHVMLADAGGIVADHPFCCDDAAQHHVIDEGWMWQLRFDQGTTSAGFVLDMREHPLRDDLETQVEWNALLRRYPSLDRQFHGTQLTAPAGGLRRTGRLQRRLQQAAGPGWAALPNTAGFIDPLHSTGIAHTLCGIERLVQIVQQHWQRESLNAALIDYSNTVLQEIDLVDRLVAACYDARDDFRLFCGATMLYFVAATTYERRRISGELAPGRAFLCADDATLRRTLLELADILARRFDAPDEPFDLAEFERNLATAIEPYNTAGLCDPAAHNMYRYTAAK